SASTLLALQERGQQKAPNALLAFADPAPVAFASNGRRAGESGVLGGLPYSRLEVQGAERAWAPGKSRVYVGTAASEAVLKREALKDYEIVHFAAHGIPDGRAPRFSAVALAPGGGEDGLLQAHEIRHLRLRARVVVLSACQSASLGEQIDGEGVLGVSQAFLAAGARSVVASLWAVEDEITAKLMTAFHKNLASTGASPEAALRRARLEVLRNSATAHPFYWGAFVLNGL
ncbi:MAG: CHAT domain-containing protein, partial [Acidobacteria bacterium]|nr:CHAT domain-containing protein [Acidobacteriota bacterium]